MRLGVLKSVGHNIADSLASGIGLMIGYYSMDVFLEAAGEPDGFVLVDFLAGVTDAKTVSEDFRKAIESYNEALPSLCSRHGVALSEFTELKVRYRTDVVYGPHFTVTVQNRDGKRSVDQYFGRPGKRLRLRR